MSNLYRGLSIDASYQVSVHLAEGRFKCEKLMDDRQWTLFLVMEVGAHRSTYHDYQSYQYEHILLYGFREVVFTISYYVTQCIK